MTPFTFAYAPTLLTRGRCSLIHSKDTHQPFLGNDQGIAVHQKEAVLMRHVPCGKKDVAEDDAILLDPEALVRIRSAKGTAVMGTAQGDLQQDAVGLAGRPDAISFIMHAGHFQKPDPSSFSPLCSSIVSKYNFTGGKVKF